ncbi:retrovirus-related pol polyprotein from transposon TNT 1-94 [Tanacetum coccineum]
MSYLLSQFILLNLNSSKSIVAANGDSMPLVGIGSVDTSSIALSNVYYIPILTMILTSVSRICDSGCDVNFSVSDCCIYDRKTQEVVGKGHRQGDLYVLDHFRDIHDTASSSVDLSSFWLNRSSSAFYLWHSHLDHVFGSRLLFFASTRALGKIDTHDISDCSGCKLEKFSAQPFSSSISSSTAPFDLVHYDVWDLLLYPPKETSCTDTPRQNGVAKRNHRHLIETTRSFLLSADVPSVFLGEAVLIATYVINRIPTAHNSSLSPFEKLYGTSPDYSTLRVFGCTCFVLKPHVERTKLYAKSTLCVFLGYSVSQKGYRCYDLIGQKFYTSRHVDFLEHISYYSVPVSSHNLTQSELKEIDLFEEPTLIVSPITPKLASETTSETTATTETPPVIIFEATPTVTQPPHTTTQLSSKVVVVPPANVQPTRIRKSTRKDDFVYSCYSSSFSSFIAYVHRFHELESYRAVVCDPLWQIVMAKELAALHQTQTWDLVPLPVGKRAIGSRWVYKIKTKSDGSIKSLLVMALAIMIIALFLNNQVLAYTLSLYYVDDMVIIGDDCVGIELLKLEFAHHFAMKDLGLLHYFLGIKVASSPKGYLLSQSKYICDLLDRVDKMVEDIPIDAKAKYTPTDVDPLPDPSLYRTIVGSLIYLTVTHPDISYAIHIVSQFVLAPTTVHWAAVLHILRYLRGTQFQTLLFPSTSALDLRAYCDSDWAGDVVSRKSTTGFCIFLGDSLIS